MELHEVWLQTQLQHKIISFKEYSDIIEKLGVEKLAALKKAKTINEYHRLYVKGEK